MLNSLILASQLSGLSLVAGPVTVTELLTAIGEQAEVKLEVHGELSDVEMVVAFSDRPLEEVKSALAELLDAKWPGNVLYRLAIVQNAYLAQTPIVVIGDYQKAAAFFDWIQSNGPVVNSSEFNSRLITFFEERPMLVDAIHAMNDEDFLRFKNGYVTPLYEEGFTIAFLTLNESGTAVKIQTYEQNERNQTVWSIPIKQPASPTRSARDILEWSYTNDWTTTNFMHVDFPVLSKILEGYGLRGYQHSVHRASIKLDRPTMGYYTPGDGKGNGNGAQAYYRLYKEHDDWMLFRPRNYYYPGFYSRHSAAIGSAIRLKDSDQAFDLAAQFTQEHRYRYQDTVFRSILWPRRLIVERMPRFNAEFWQQLPPEHRRRLREQGLTVDEVPPGLSRLFSNVVLSIVSAGSYVDGRPVGPELREEEVRGLRLFLTSSYTLRYQIKFGTSGARISWHMIHGYNAVPPGPITNVAMLDEHVISFRVQTPSGRSYSSTMSVIFVVGSADYDEIKGVPEEDHEAWFAARAKVR